MTEAGKPANYDAVRNEWLEANLTPLWESATAHRPGPAAEPSRLWKWSMLRAMADKAIAAVSPADVERRALTLVNPRPGPEQPSTTLRTMSSAIQILLPGECARPHRHSINAIRFVLEGRGAVTVVNGKECPMNEGDLVLTPGWTWHEHVHKGEMPVIWLDVLDGPLHRFLGAAVFENGPANNIPLTVPDAVFASANLAPDVVLPHDQHSPVFSYPYASAAAAVAAAPLAPDGVRRVRYINPINGGSAIAIMETSLIQIDAGTISRPVTSTVNALCCVVEGSGSTRIGDTSIEWGPKDVFTMPHGQVVQHRGNDQTARLFIASDREVQSRLGLLRESIDGQSRQS